MIYLSSLGFNAYLALGIEVPRSLPVSSPVLLGRLETLSHLVEPRSVHDEYLRFLIDSDPDIACAYDRFARERRRWHVLGEDHDVWNEWDYDRGDESLAVTARSDVRDEHERGQRVERADREEVTRENGAGEPDPSYERGTSSEAGGRGAEPPEGLDPLILELKVGAGDKRFARIWDVHKGDRDPYPSIPHGHEVKSGQTLKNIKLDVYRGDVYNHDKIVGRESRSAIAQLWNDAKFRSFAHQAVVHMINADPTFVRRLRDERGVKNPLRLPRRR